MITNVFPSWLVGTTIPRIMSLAAYSLSCAGLAFCPCTKQDPSERLDMVCGFLYQLKNFYNRPKSTCTKSRTKPCQSNYLPGQPTTWSIVQEGESLSVCRVQLNVGKDGKGTLVKTHCIYSHDQGARHEQIYEPCHFDDLHFRQETSWPC